MENTSNAGNISAIHLQANKVYEYAYEGRVKVGSTSKDLPASELKISSTIKFTGSSGSDYFIQVRVGANEVEERAMCPYITLSMFGMQQCAAEPSSQ